MGKPTAEDARTILELAKIAFQSELAEALDWVWTGQLPADYDGFTKKYPKGSREYRMADQACGFFETIGALWKHGLINEELLFDWVWVGGPWERLKGFALGMRKEAGNPRIYELFEAMVEAEKKAEAKVPVAAGRN